MPLVAVFGTKYGMVQNRPHLGYTFTSLYVIRCSEGVCVCVCNESAQDTLE